LRTRLNLFDVSVIDVIGKVLVGIAVLLGLPAAGLAVLVGLEEWYTAHALRNLARYRRAAVSGQTAGGQVAPVSGKPCAWWRVAIMQWRHDSEGGEWREVWHRACGDSVAVIGRPGTAPVSAALFEHELRGEGDVTSVLRKSWEDGPDSGGLGVDKLVTLGFVPRDRFQAGYVVETLVPAGIPVVAVGRMKRGVLSRSLWGMGVNGVSTLTLEEVSRRASKQEKETWSMVRGLGVAGLIFLVVGWGLIALAAAYVEK